MPKSHYDFSDEEYMIRFKAMTFPPRLFSHEAHLRLAFLHIQQYGVTQAARNMQDQIKGLALKFGATKYHDTITVAAVNAVNHFHQLDPELAFPALIAKHTVLMSDFKALLNSHYSYDIFTSALAKESYQAPDIQPFELA